MGSSWLFNENTTASTMFRSGVWLTAGDILYKRSIQTAWTAQNNSIGSRTTIECWDVETHLWKTENLMEIIYYILSSDQGSDWWCQCSNRTVVPKCYSLSASWLGLLLPLAEIVVNNPVFETTNCYMCFWQFCYSFTHDIQPTFN
jgi:hypothetical protein